MLKTKFIVFPPYIRTLIYEYMCFYEHTLAANRYEQQEQAIACGQMLRECAKFEPLARVVIQAEQLYDFFRYVEHPSFDVASDAFLTFKVTNCSTGIINTIF